MARPTRWSRFLNAHREIEAQEKRGEPGATSVRIIRMPSKKSSGEDYVHYHKDGSIWATGKRLKGKPTGYWEWFRKDGSKLRSGYFAKGVQTGEWTTYDRKGDVYKVTVMKPKRPKKKS